MPHVYAGSDVNATSVTLPDDGDDKNAASVNVPFEAIWDRLTHLNLPEITGSPYPFPAGGISLTRMQRMPVILTASEWSQIPFLDVWLAVGATPVQLVQPLLLPLQSELTDLLFYVSAGSGHGGLPGPGDRPTVNVYEYDPATQTATLMAGPVEDPKTSVSIASYEAPHVIPVSLSWFPDPINMKYFATLTTEGGVNAEVGFRFDACQTVSTIFVQDPE